MSATQPIGVDSTPASGEQAVRAQLDALSKGEIDPETLLNNVKARARLEPDYDWEVLSLLDQYYRRGKIDVEVFRTLKNGFAEYILGPKNSAPAHAVSAPQNFAPTQTPQAPRNFAPTQTPQAPQNFAPTQAPQAPTLHTVVSPPPKSQAAQAAAAAAAAPVKSAPVTTAPPPVAPAPMPAAFAPVVAAPTREPTYNYTVQGAAPQAPSVRASAAEPAREAEVGDLLRNRYRLESFIGRGTSGNVFEATDPLRLNLPPLGKRVAIKVLHPDPRGIYIEQLRQEFHHLQVLSHPNIVRAFDFDRDGALAFFTMELLHGELLNSILRARGTPLQRQHAFAIIRDVGDAIAYAHSRGTVHGDINPRTVFITTRGDLRVLRFGAWNRLSGNDDLSEFEHASAVPDTGRYASCEVLHGNRPNESDDLYALSCLAYLLLTGRHAYADRTSIEARAERKRPRRPSGLTYRQWLALRAGLQTDAKKRPSDVRAWLEAMELGAAAKHLLPPKELAETPAIKPTRWPWAVAAALLAALIGGGYWFYTDPNAFGLKADVPAIVQDVMPTPDAVVPATSVKPSAPTSGAAPRTGSPAAGSPAAQWPVAPPPAAQRPVSAPPGTAPRASNSVPAAGVPTMGLPANGSASAGVPAKSLATSAPAAAPSMAGAAAAAHSAAASQTPARIEMTADTLDALPTDSVVHVTLRRKGSLHGATSFTWWTESGTAKPGVDFAPVLPHVQQMQDGEGTAVLSVVLLPTVRSQSKGFYVGIEEADGGAQISGRSLTQITLPSTN
jgi:hypothetical protein